jgi:hypothetical protein
VKNLKTAKLREELIARIPFRDEVDVIEITEALDAYVESITRFTYDIGDKVWFVTHRGIGEDTIKFIHIQRGLMPGSHFIRYEMTLTSGWHREVDLFTSREEAEKSRT